MKLSDVHPGDVLRSPTGDEFAVFLIVAEPTVSLTPAHSHEGALNFTKSAFERGDWTLVSHKFNCAALPPEESSCPD